MNNIHDSLSNNLKMSGFHITTSNTSISSLWGDFCTIIIITQEYVTKTFIINIKLQIIKNQIWLSKSESESLLTLSFFFFRSLVLTNIIFFIRNFLWLTPSMWSLCSFHHFIYLRCRWKFCRCRGFIQFDIHFCGGTRQSFKWYIIINLILIVWMVRFMFILYMSPNIILSIALIITMNTLVKHFVKLRFSMMWTLTCFIWDWAMSKKAAFK